MRKKAIDRLAAIKIFLVISCILAGSMAWGQVSTASQSAEWVPAGGNSWVLKQINNESIEDSGLTHWSDPRTVCRTYFRISEPGQIHLFLKIHPDSEAQIRLHFLNNSKLIHIHPADSVYDAGKWAIPDTGYVHVDLQGVRKSGKTFGRFEGLLLSGSSKLDFVRDNTGNYFYWGRRGPSVHLNYELDTAMQVEWFYNEISVPFNNDVVGSYYMANGFGEGYFGMQVNSEKERRILFSIWSPYTTDDPGAIPDSLKIRLLAKGTDVHTGEFGNEGSGGQSYWRFSWKAGNTYRFLTRAEPLADHSTIYTSWFFAPERGRWKLLASFKRPSTTTYLKRLHSFLENFEPETGWRTRKVLFSEQWACGVDGRWKQVTRARFTVDQTGRKNFRKDFAGGVAGHRFFLQNDGFFNRFVLPGSLFQRNKNTSRPLTPGQLNRFKQQALDALKAAGEHL